MRRLAPFLPLSHFTLVKSQWDRLALPHLYQHVGCVVKAHDQRSHPGHVVHVGKGDEGDCCQVVQEHDEKILHSEERKEEKTLQVKAACWGECVVGGGATRGRLLCAHTMQFIVHLRARNDKLHNMLNYCASRSFCF